MDMPMEFDALTHELYLRAVGLDFQQDSSFRYFISLMDYYSYFINIRISLIVRNKFYIEF
jgi:hypothetical protein